MRVYEKSYQVYDVDAHDSWFYRYYCLCDCVGILYLTAAGNASGQIKIGEDRLTWSGLVGVTGTCGISRIILAAIFCYAVRDTF